MSSTDKPSLEHNFRVINEVITNKKVALMNNKYSKSVPLASYNDKLLVTHLEAVYNILQNIDERLKKLEENNK